MRVKVVEGITDVMYENAIRVGACGEYIPI